jgi:pimeloyl-ACP methyl ester carboxylesterase
MHDFGGPMGIGFALRHPDRISRLIATNTPLPLGLPSQDALITNNPAEAPWFRWIAETYRNGSLEPTLQQLSYNVLSTMWLNGFLGQRASTLHGCAPVALPFPLQRNAQEHLAGHGEWDQGRFVLKKETPLLLRN